MITDKEIDEKLFNHYLVRADLTSEELSALIRDMEFVKSGGILLDGVICSERLREITTKRAHAKLLMKQDDVDKLREMIARCEWTFAKTMPWCPHEYIVRGKCPLSEEEFLFFIDIQRGYGKIERWGKYITPYLYIDNYKYWTMGAPVEETIVMNRAKVETKKE